MAADAGGPPAAEEMPVAGGPPAAEEMPVAAFSGQGIPSGQLAELRRVAKHAAAFAFLQRLSRRLELELEELVVLLQESN